MKKPLYVRQALQFEAGYAAGSDMTVEDLRRLGRIVAPCRCGEPGCAGWQSINRESWESDEWYQKRHGGVGWTWPPETPSANSPPFRGEWLAEWEKGTFLVRLNRSLVSTPKKGGERHMGDCVAGEWHKWEKRSNGPRHVYYVCTRCGATR